MRIDPERHSSGDNYKLLTNLVVPRPIAWVTSLGDDGVVNLAPFSFFNAVGAEPLFVVVSIGRRDDGTPKDTARNIAAGRDFVVNLVTPELLGAMNVSAVEFPENESELVAAGVHAAPSERVGSPRLAEALVSLECTLHQAIPLGTNTLFIGEVVMFHVADHPSTRACASMGSTRSAVSARRRSTAAPATASSSRASATRSGRR